MFLVPGALWNTVIGPLPSENGHNDLLTQTTMLLHLASHFWFVRPLQPGERIPRRLREQLSSREAGRGSSTGQVEQDDHAPAESESTENRRGGCTRREQRSVTPGSSER